MTTKAKKAQARKQKKEKQARKQVRRLEHRRNALTPAAALMVPQTLAQAVVQSAIRGRGDGDAAFDPLATLGVDASVLAQHARQSDHKYVDNEDLLGSAHEYFKDFGRDELTKKREAMRKLHHMRKVNKEGGDRDGFKFVLPKSTRAFVENEMGVMNSAQLESTYGGDGVMETAEKPGRKNVRKAHKRDDFYQFQVLNKWTRNAENFLARGRAGKKLFEPRHKPKQKPNRNFSKKV
jgi:hypothetical protein